MATSEVTRKSIGAGLSALAGVVLGVASAGAALWSVRAPGEIAVGPWRTSVALGSASAGLYLRAQVAIDNLFALERRQTLYYLATTDGRGAPLRGACSYRITGTALDARWWSITAYGADRFLIPNAADRYSYTMANVHRGPDGRFSIGLGPKPMEGDWLPSNASGPVTLVMRLYNPAPALAASPGSAAMPTIEPIGGCP
jgi:hypothetical protein